MCACVCSLNPSETYADTVRVEPGQLLLIRARLAEQQQQMSVTAQQVFVQLTHTQSQQAITFVAGERAAVGGAKEYLMKLVRWPLLTVGATPPD